VAVRGCEEVAEEWRGGEREERRENKGGVQEKEWKVSGVTVN